VSHWTIENIPSQVGCIHLITGANSGTGLAATQQLAQSGALVIMAVRDIDKGRQAAAQIKQAIPNAKLDIMHLNLADLKSVAQFALEFKSRYKQLNVLINNAGIALPNTRIETKQGYEGHFGVNHLGHFALTGMLLPILMATPHSRIVTVASFVPKQSHSVINWHDLQYHDNFDGMTCYGQSKLANIMFGLQLHDKLQQANSSTLSLIANPGFTKTNIQKDMGFFAKFLTLTIAQSVAIGVLPLLRCAVDPDVTSGQFYGPLKLKEMRGYPELTQAPKPAANEPNREKLWLLSEQMTQTTYIFS